MDDPRPLLASIGIDSATTTRVHGGSGTAIWKVETPTNRYALRVFQVGHEPVIENESAAMRLASDAGLPVPRLHQVGSWENRPFMLIDWLNGEPLIKVLQRRPFTSAKLLRDFGATQARMHRISAPSEYRTLHRRDWVKAAHDPDIAVKLLTVPDLCDGDSARLIHLDYHPLNAMSDGSTITGIIDWTNAAAGDPRADVARTYTILRVEPWLPSIARYPMALIRMLWARAWMQGYVSVAGELKHMDVFKVWAGMFMARDLAPRAERGDSWFGKRQIDMIRRWTDAQRRGL